MVRQEYPSQRFVVRHQGCPQHAGRVSPSWVRLTTVDALELGTGHLLVPHEVTVRGDEPLYILLGEDQPVLEGRDDSLNIDP